MTARQGDQCTIVENGEQCPKPVVGREWCSMHYARWQRYGDPLHKTRHYVAQGDECGHRGCDAKPKYNGLCGKHVERQVRRGETTEPRARRFWAQVDKRGPDECWPWKGHVQPNGYGTFGMKGTRSAHRIAYIYAAGPIPRGLVLDHLCHTRERDTCRDNEACPHRRCVNPAHLEAVPRRENIARGHGGDSWGYVPEPVPVKLKVEKPLACVNGCDKPLYKRNLCRPCYRKWLRDPSVERPSQRTPEQRFWAKVRKTETCWLWTASVNAGTGYGQFAHRHGEPVDAHRFSYELASGAIPYKHDVHHKCHTRHCVNPAHLEAVTRADNLRLRKDRRIA